MKQKWVKVMALLGLLGIILSVIGTGMLYLMQSNSQSTLSKQDLQKMIDSGQITINQKDTEANTAETETSEATDTTVTEENSETVDTTGEKEDTEAQ